jgi:hypothetical protein
MRRNISLDLQTTSKHLFGQPLNLFECIRGYPFTRGLPKSKILQHSATARVFKTAIACDGISEPNFKDDELKKALENIWRNGWLHAQESNNDVRYVFASTIHRW